jgi:hypothetical protein
MAVPPNSHYGADARHRAGVTLVRIRSVAGALLALAALTTIFYMESVHGWAGSSDKATAILEGQAMTRGNVLLHGWSLPVSSYWTTDALMSALLIPIVGTQQLLMNLQPALTTALFVAVGAFAATRDVRGRQAVTAAVVTVVALTVFAPPMMEFYLNAGAYHVGTGLFALLAFLALRRAKFNIGWAAAVAILGVGALGDLELFAYGTAPVLVCGVTSTIRQRHWKAGAPLLSAGASSVALFLLLERVKISLGGFHWVPHHRGVSLADLGRNLKDVVVVFADFLGGSGNWHGYLISRVDQWWHLPGAVIVVFGLAYGVYWLVRRVVSGSRAVPHSGSSDPRILDELLVLATLGAACTFVLEADTGIRQARYMTVSVLFACVLAGRVAGRLWPGVPALGRRVTMGVAGLALLGLAGTLGLQLSQPAMQSPPNGLIALLESHHLRWGIAGYWSASVVTVDSRGSVVIRPVVIERSQIVAMSDEVDSAWYRRSFQFLVLDQIQSDARLSANIASASFGPPSHVYRVDTWKILTWSHRVSVHTINLTPRLAAAPSTPRSSRGTAARCCTRVVSVRSMAP